MMLGFILFFVPFFSAWAISKAYGDETVNLEISPEGLVISSEGSDYSTSLESIKGIQELRKWFVIKIVNDTIDEKMYFRKSPEAKKFIQYTAELLKN